MNPTTQEAVVSAVFKPTGKDKGGFFWDIEGIAKQVAEKGNPTSLSNTQLQKVTKIMNSHIQDIEDSTDAIAKAVVLTIAAADKAEEDLKKRVSSIKNYQNQLVTAIANLNKTINDKQLETLVSNAGKLVTALEALDTLAKAGSLDNIVSALTKKG